MVFQVRRGSHSAAAPERRVDLPTLGIVLAVYSGFFSLTYCFYDLPAWIAAPLLSLLLAWYGSLQHETIHDHPTRSRRFNSLIASPPLALWIPYAVYRHTHLWHHRSRGRHLTHPTLDPESFYLPPGALSDAGVLRRAVYWANCTLSGRMVLGPALALLAFWDGELRKLRAGERFRLIVWSRHVIGVAAVLAWTVGVCRIPFLVYVGFVVYPSISIGQLRSFAEHRADEKPDRRTAVVEANPLLALIFLNNNLHIAHHAYPKLSWYRLPRAWAQMRGSMSGGAPIYQGYRQVVRQYLFSPVITAEHPAPAGEE